MFKRISVDSLVVRYGGPVYGFTAVGGLGVRDPVYSLTAVEGWGARDPVYGFTAVEGWGVRGAISRCLNNRGKGVVP